VVGAAAGYELMPRRELAAGEIQELQRDDIWYAVRRDSFAVWKQS